MSLNQLIDEFTLAAQSLKVGIVGETIIDEFVKVSYEGQSMKSMCPVFRLTGEKQEQKGGASAIASHLSGFVKNVDLITNSANEIVKTRYVDIDDQKKHVEINKFDTEGFKEVTVNASDYDLFIVADFGHGFCDQLKINGNFHLMCQTNSNNFGFNRVSKWKKYRKKSVCLDLREASLQMNKRIKYPSDAELLELYGYELETDHLFLTLGSKGSIFTDGKITSQKPSYKSNIVDTIGAGDTFFAFACLASHLDMPADQVLTIPSLAASLSTTWLCNEQSVTPSKLKKYATGIIS